MMSNANCKNCKFYRDCSIRKQKEEALGLGENVDYYCEKWEEE